jgi:hypothetical protein
VEDDRLADLAAQLAVFDKAPQTSVQALVEDARAVRDNAVLALADGNGEHVGLDLPGELDLDRDVRHADADGIRAGIYVVLTKSPPSLS